MKNVRHLPARLLLIVLAVFAFASRAAWGRSTVAPPPLPRPTGTVVAVSTEPQLQAAVRALSSNTTIVIAPGTYRLTTTLQIRGDLANVAIRGATDVRDDIVLTGRGMTQATEDVPYGIWVGGRVDGLLIANLTIRDLYRHAIIFNPGTERPRVYNVRLLDAGQQLIKSNPDGAGGGVNDAVVEYSVIEYTRTAPSDYTNGIDVHAGARWIIRDNLFRNIVGPPGTLAGPAVLMWNHSSDTVTERNRFVNCARGISYGLQVARFDHTGGIIRNNLFFRGRGQPGDVGIHVADSPRTRVVNNTVIVSGTYRTPIEYRYAGAQDVVIANNLTDGVIVARDGATGAVDHNVVDAAAEMFVDGVTGNLHLVAQAASAIDKGRALADVADDWDGNARPAGAGYDVGAIEYGARPRTATAADATPPISQSRSPEQPSPVATPTRSVEPPPRVATPNRRLVQRTDLSYEGAFRVPAGQIGGSSFEYAWTGLAFNPERQSLFVTGHDWHQQVAEISIPAIRRGAAPTALATATVLQPFADPTEGRLQTINPGDPNAKKIGGLFVYHRRLYMTGYAYYDGASTQKLSHFVSGPDFAVKGDVRGPFAVGTVGAGFVSGYFGAVPAEWRDALGGPVVNGQCCIAVIGRSSYGPALSAIDPAQLGVAQPLPATPLVYYPKTYPLLDAGTSGDGWSNTSTLFNGTTEVRGVVFPEGTGSVLFFGRHGAGGFCYGPGTGDKAKAGKPAIDAGDTRDPWCYDPADSSKGTHAYPYVYYVWAYDAKSLAAVKAGRMQPWDVRPYATWKLDLPFAAGVVHLNGAAYDPATRRIFLSQAFADGNSPIIHVFKLAP